MTALFNSGRAETRVSALLSAALSSGIKFKGALKISIGMRHTILVQSIFLNCGNIHIKFTIRNI